MEMYGTRKTLGWKGADIHITPKQG